MHILLLIIQLVTFSHASNLNPKLDIPEVQCDQSLTQEIQDKIYRSFSSLDCWMITKIGACAVTSAGATMALAGQLEIMANKKNQATVTKTDYAKLRETYAKLFEEEKTAWKLSPQRSSGINERGIEFKWITPTRYGQPDDPFSGRLMQKLGGPVGALRGIGLLTAFFGASELLQIKGSTISKCAGLAKEVDAYVSTMEENGKCSTVPAIGSKEIEFLNLPAEKQSELLKSNKYLCSHFKNVSANFELITQSQSDLWFKDVSVRDIKCSPSGDLNNYTLSSKNFVTAVQFERRQSENAKTLKVTHNQGSDKISSELEYSKDSEWKNLTKVTWDNKLPAWRGSRSVAANRFDAASEWEGSSIRDSVRYSYLNEFWGGKAEKCCSMSGEQRASCIADLDVRPKKKNSVPGGIK